MLYNVIVNGQERVLTSQMFHDALKEAVQCKAVSVTVFGTPDTPGILRQCEVLREIWGINVYVYDVDTNEKYQLKGGRL